MVAARVRSRWPLCAAIGFVVVVGWLARGWVLLSPSGVMNADEAYTGLQAADILDGRLQIVIQGSAYTAVLESYAFAPFVLTFGNHVLPLKLLGICGWALASLAMWGAGRRLIGPRGGAVAGATLWLAPGAMMIVSTRAYVGYSLGMALVIAAAWAIAASVDEQNPDPRSSSLAGALAGLACYCHPMFLAVVAPMAAVGCFVHRRHVRRWWIPASAAAIAVNLPFLLWNAVNGWPSLDQPTQPNESAVDRLGRFFSGLMPRALVLRSQAGEWIFTRPLSLAIYALVASAVVLGALRLVRTPGRARSRGLIVVAPLVLCWPLMASLSNLGFVGDGRYAIVPLPFVVLASASSVEWLCERLDAVRRSSRFAPAAVVAVWAVLLVAPFLRHDVGTDLGDPNEQVSRVVAELRAHGIDRVAGSYWWVLPIEYQSDRQVRAAVAGNPFVVRFPSSQRLVEGSPAETVAFVFESYDDNQSVLRLPIDEYDRTVIGGAILYLPKAMETSE